MTDPIKGLFVVGVIIGASVTSALLFTLWLIFLR